MSSEFNILINIYTDLKNNIDNIKHAQYNFLQIKNNIENFNNDYFKKYCSDELFQNYLQIYENIDYEDYNKHIEKLELIKENIELKLQNLCNHEWVEDLIDINPEKSKYICYCVKCEVTRK